MNRTALGILGLLVVVPALWALDDPKDKDKTKPKSGKPPTPQEAYQAIEKEYQKAQQDFFKAYQAAKTNEEKQKIYEKQYPKVEDYVSRFLELAEKHAKDPVAEKALTWIVQNASYTPNGQKAMDILLKQAQDNPKDPKSGKTLAMMVQFAAYTPGGRQAVDMLLKDHIQSKDLGPVCQSLLYSDNAEGQLQKIIDKNPHKEVKGQAFFTLAQVLKKQSEGVSQDKEKATKETENMLQLTIEKYGDVVTPQGKLVDRAKSLLEEIRLFGYGKQMPDVEGEDLDGKKFKLGDYLGKVVLLDFWGNW
jgi:tetratricopeptide (TPR) repeat protein